MDTYEKKEIMIYNNIKFLSLKSNDYFGDSALDSNTTRNATIIASEDCDVGYIETSLYYNNIGEEKIKIINKKIYFLIQNFFFKRINPRKFEKKFFGYFICNNYKKGDILYKENEMPLFVYFIEEGKVELSSSKNAIEIEKTIETLNKQRQNFDEFLKNERKNTDSKNENNKNIYDGEFLYDKIKNNCKDLIKHLKKREKNKLFILGRNEDLGIISYYFNYPYMTDCVVSSNTAKIYKINIKYLNEIIRDENKCLIDLNKRIKYKLLLFQERFFNINNTKLLIADKKETNIKNERIENENIIKKMIICIRTIFYINIIMKKME
jgi:CRP-like cAMP-binding protein